MLKSLHLKANKLFLSDAKFDVMGRRDSLSGIGKVKRNLFCLNWEDGNVGNKGKRNTQSMTFLQELS